MSADNMVDTDARESLVELAGGLQRYTDSVTNLLTTHQETILELEQRVAELERRLPPHPFGG